MDRSEFINRSRRAARVMITISDSVNALTAEAALTDAFALPEDGGLRPEDFTGRNADITREDMLAFYAVLAAIFGQLTPEQKRAFYRLKDNETLGIPLPGTPII